MTAKKPKRKKLTEKPQSVMADLVDMSAHI